MPFHRPATTPRYSSKRLVFDLSQVGGQSIFEIRGVAHWSVVDFPFVGPEVFPLLFLLRHPPFLIDYTREFVCAYPTPSWGKANEQVCDCLTKDRGNAIFFEKLCYSK